MQTAAQRRRVADVSQPPTGTEKLHRAGAPRQQDAQTLPALDMLHAQKAALQNSVRQRLVGIRQRELEYYTLNCRSVGNQAALIAGFAYSGIHYHYLLEHQYGWQLSEEDSIEEVIFLSLLTMSLGCALQVSIWHGRLPIDCTDDHNQPVLLRRLSFWRHWYPYWLQHSRCAVRTAACTTRLRACRSGRPS